MTESDWFTCTDPHAMLTFLRDRGASDRKLRLFAVACCRVVWKSLTHPASKLAVELAERYADGLVGDTELGRAHVRAYAVIDRFRGRNRMFREGPSPLEQRLLLAAESAHVHKPFLVPRIQGIRQDSDLARQAPPLLRDIFANLFGSVTIAPEWRTSTVAALAADVYRDRAFDRMPILADALQDAGCDNADILHHCRDPQQVHVRGCWVVDLVLGKE